VVCYGMGYPDDLIKRLEELGESEVRKRTFGDPGSPNDGVVQAWLRRKEIEREEARNVRQEAREEENLSISRKAIRIAKWAIIISIVAITVSTITAIIIAYLSKQ